MLFSITSHIRDCFTLVSLPSSIVSKFELLVEKFEPIYHSLFHKKHKVFPTHLRFAQDSLLASVDNTKSTSNPTSTNLATTSFAPETIRTEKRTSGEARMTSNAASLPSRPSSDSGEIRDILSAEPSNTLQVGDAGTADYQPEPPSRSLTQIISDPKTFERFAETFSSMCQEGGKQQPVMVNNFGNVAKIEIINGSLPGSDPASNVTESVIEAPQKTKTTKLASLLGWVAKLPRPKPFTVWCKVKDAQGMWQSLEVFLDTGGRAGNLITYSKVKALGLLERIEKSGVTIYTLGDNELKIEGQIEIVGKWDGYHEHPIIFYVVDRNNKHVTETMLGGDTIGTFRLVRIRFGMTNKGPARGVTPNKPGDDTDLSIHLAMANKE